MEGGRIGGQSGVEKFHAKTASCEARTTEELINGDLRSGRKYLNLS